MRPTRHVLTMHINQQTLKMRVSHTIIIPPCMRATYTLNSKSSNLQRRGPPIASPPSPLAFLWIQRSSLPSASNVLVATYNYFRSYAHIHRASYRDFCNGNPPTFRIALPLYPPMIETYWFHQRCTTSYNTWLKCSQVHFRWRISMLLVGCVYNAIVRPLIGAWSNSMVDPFLTAQWPLRDASEFAAEPKPTL